jgi:predicted metal-dependent hydrolase
VWGRRIRLQVVAGSARNRVFLAGDTSLVLHVREPSPAEVERTLDGWDRSQLTNAIPGLIGRWAPIIGVEVHAWGIRKMSTRWGSCNPEAHRVSLNLELARERPEYLEYVVIHEMVHIREPRHDRRFELLMDRFLPDWRTRRRELNHGPRPHARRVSEEPAGV